MKHTLYICWLIALAGCGVSMYYGEIMMLEPCRFCWYQRMALFPLALILGVAAYRNDSSAIRYALPLCAFGGAAAFFQALGIHVPSLEICTKECAKPIFSLFDGFSFSDMSVLGFIAMGAMLLIFSRRRSSN